MQVLLGAATAGFQDSDRRTRLPSSVAAVLLHLALGTWLSGPGSLVAGGQLSLSLAGSAIENAPRTSSDGRTDKVLYI